SDVPAGPRVVVQVEEPASAKTLGGDFQKCISRIVGNPRKDAVRDDEIELADKLLVRLEKVGANKFHVGQCQGPFAFLSNVNLAPSSVDANKSGLLAKIRHRQQVRPIPAPQLQHPILVQRRSWPPM